ncbi:FmdB family zinc ribbon protein [Nocardiopsis algeriensis]|uniref:Putative FmdB family regulatory protein n=1 Tax=Nocardiopsis algeriensis TaxID=1478215 RepID=A0A841IH70_9ACTN|nr:putative FmdB family regulatory protein [Nocardiopsis algeriensis]
MPTYQYACTECGAQSEVVQSFTDDALTVCSECDGRLRKVYSAVGIVFKGSGFYRTDSGKTSSSSSLPSAGTSSPESGTAASGTKASDTKASDTKSADSGSTAKTGTAPAATGS